MSLSPQQIKQNREDFLDICNNTTILPNSLYHFLEQSDFWRAPASTKYHEAYEGGLVQHSLKVYEQLSMLNYNHFLNIPDESITKTALFHDLCKVNFYRKTYKNKKMEDGRWQRVEGYEVNDDLPLGHGEKSLFLLVQHGVSLTEEEALAIRWHMGAWNATGYQEEQALAGAMNKHRLVTALHIADMMAVWVCR